VLEKRVMHLIGFVSYCDEMLLGFIRMLLRECW